MTTANIGRQILPHGDLAARLSAGTVARQAHEIHLRVDAHGLRERRKRVHRTLEHANQQRVLATVVFTGLGCSMVDDVGNLFFTDQLVINIFLYVSDSHAHHLGTRE